MDSGAPCGSVWVGCPNHTRVEKDQTPSLESLGAIAAAFGTEVNTFKTQYLVPESKPPVALMVRTIGDFAATMNWSAHCHSRTIFLRPKPDHEVEIRRLMKQILEDLADVHGEPELEESYLEGIAAPLSELRKKGLAFFVILTRKDLFLPDPSGTTSPRERCMENWGTVHYVLVPESGAFRLGDANSRSKVHRFEPQCSEAVESVLNALEREAIVLSTIWNSPLALVDSGNDPFTLCPGCFPHDMESVKQFAAEYVETTWHSPEFQSLLQEKRMSETGQSVN